VGRKEISVACSVINISLVYAQYKQCACVTVVQTAVQYVF
jgi:hypothetical protein